MNSKMTPFQSEQVEILRRIAERGLKLAQQGDPGDYKFIDVFQHLLDEIERLI